MQLSKEEIAQEAKDLLDRESVQLAFETIRSRLLYEFENSSPLRAKTREAVYYELRALESLKAQLGSLANEPKIAAYKGRRKITSSF